MTLNHYLAHRRISEAGFWVLLLGIHTTVGATSVLMEFARYGKHIEPWEPFVWEYSSAVVLLLLIVILLWFDRRFPITLANVRNRLGWHVLGSVVFGLAHTAGFVAIRKAIYAWAGGHYDFGSVPVELVYEYRKQIVSYFTILAVIYTYRFVLRRLQGEASFLGRPDEGEAVEPTERPRRFLVQKLGRQFLINVADIEWIEASGNYVNLHVKGRAYPLRSTFSGIEEKLDPARFVRVHRSYIVNLDRVREIRPLDSGDSRIILDDGAEISLSRRYRRQFRSLPLG